MAKLTLGYWDVRGIGEPARMMLEYGGIDYEDQRYKCGQEPPYDRSMWTDVKFKLNLDFPNLPYLIEGENRVTESWAVYRYIAKKADLLPKTEKATYECDMLQGVIESLRMSFAILCYNPDFENMKSEVRQNLPVKIRQFEQFLAGRKFLAGDKLTYVDFALYQTLDHQRLLFPDILDEFPHLQALMKKMESTERISAYLKSDRYRKFPINNPVAQWGIHYE